MQAMPNPDAFNNARDLIFTKWQEEESLSSFLSQYLENGRLMPRDWSEDRVSNAKGHIKKP